MTVDDLTSMRHYAINLPHRTDRWAELGNVFRIAQLPVPMRVEACSGFEMTRQQLDRFSRPNTDPGGVTFANAAATAVSHRRAMQTAWSDGATLACFWEDDAWPHPQIVARWTGFARRMLDAVDRWDLLSVGCTHKAAPDTVADGVLRVARANTATGYVLHRDALEEAIDLLAPTAQGDGRPMEDWDQAWRLFTQRGTHLAPDPNLAVQRPSFSDISGRQVSPNTQRFTGWKGPTLEGWLT